MPGLENDRAMRVIHAVGNDGELLAGCPTPPGMPRGINTFQTRGGLQYVPARPRTIPWPRPAPHEGAGHYSERASATSWSVALPQPSWKPIASCFSRASTVACRAAAR